MVTAVIACKLLKTQRMEEHIYDYVGPSEHPAGKQTSAPLALKSNVAYCTSTHNTTRDKIEPDYCDVTSHPTHVGGVYPGPSKGNNNTPFPCIGIEGVSGCSGSGERDTPTKTELEMDGYSNPRYYEESRSRGATSSRSGTGDQSDSNSKKAVLTSLTTTTYESEARGGHSSPQSSNITTLTTLGLEVDGYSDPRYYAEEGSANQADSQSDPNEPVLTAETTSTGEGDSPRHSSIVQSRYIHTPNKRELEMDGYSDPRYYGDEGLQKGICSSSSTTDKSKATHHSSKVQFSFRNTTEMHGYRNPSYHGEGSLNAGASSSDIADQTDSHGDPSELVLTAQSTDEDISPHHSTTTVMTLSEENGGYSDPPCYCEETQRPDASLTTSSSGYTHTPTQIRADLEKDGYSDPRYYSKGVHTYTSGPADQTVSHGQLNEPLFTGHTTTNGIDSAPQPSYANPPTMEDDGYSDPRYHSERATLNTNSYSNPCTVVNNNSSQKMMGTVTHGTMPN